MSDTFTASNGVVLDAFGGWVTDNCTKVSTPAQDHEARKEFYLHERDKELGRWRWPENPEWVVYGNGPDDAVAIHEPSGVVHDLKRGHVFPWQDALTKVSEEYFDAHPKPRPWRDAKPGEVWAVTLATAGESAWCVEEEFPDGQRVFKPTIVTGHGIIQIDVAAVAIKSARRIWPEVKP